MNKKSKDKLVGTVIVPCGLAVILVPFSLLIGWNLLTLILFWFLIVPMLSIYLPSIISGNNNHLFESIVGVLIFYAIMVFMIYNHFKTDYFQIMIFSLVINLVFISSMPWFRRLSSKSK